MPYAFPEIDLFRFFCSISFLWMFNAYQNRNKKNVNVLCAKYAKCFDHLLGEELFIVPFATNGAILC